jgi:hypothetical protein
LDLKEELIFSALEDEAVTHVTELAHAWHSAASASDPWDSSGETFEMHRQGADQAYKAIGKLKLPWYVQWKRDGANELNDLLRKFYAQEQDPEFRKWRESTKKRMQGKIQSRYDGEAARKAVVQSVKQRQKDAEERQRKRRERARRTQRAAK